ncbi:MAG: hypothetical protein CMO01_25985 [Thalassobius sp.]|nr:hypothetical protein [Thalassovita sp.]
MRLFFTIKHFSMKILAHQTSLLALIVCLLFYANSDVSAQLIEKGKVSKELLNLTTQNASQRIRKSTSVDKFESSLDLQVYDGYVVFDAIAKENTETLKAELAAKGCKKLTSFGGLVSGLMPVDKISEMQAVESLKLIKAAYKPHTNIGSVTSQGDVAQLSDEARSLFSVNGAGVKVGVLSDSYDNLAGAADGIASGDLPGAANPNGFTSEVDVLLDLPSGGSDEGRAMCELVHDVAPGAELAFYSAFYGQADFANGILDLAADANCDVIVDDIIYYAEPMFQDGVIGQATDIVKSQGVTYFSSAGNQWDDSYEAPFRDGGTYLLSDFSGIPLGNYIMHDFDPGEAVDIFQEIEFPANGGSLFLTMQWDEPAASVCEGCPGATSDLDLFLVLAEDTSAVYFNLSGVDFNIGADPVELMGISAGGAVTAYLAIGKVADGSPNPSTIKYVSFDNYLFNEYLPVGSTAYGHSNANGAISVGGVRYDRTPEYGLNPPVREVFSSSGGVPTLFDIAGNPINELRLKPEISAVQGGNTTFFGFEYEGDGFPNFFGTSASAPHAAAVAALMLEASRNTLTPDEIEEAMTSTAIDMDPTKSTTVPPGTDPKFDFDTGYGYLTATNAIAEILPVPSVLSLWVTDAKTGEVISKLEEGDEIDLAFLENPINIVAEAVSGDGKLESVKLQLTGKDYERTVQNREPYALFGRNRWYPKVGDYSLEATPYSKKNARGRKGIALSIDFSVINSGKVEQYVVVNAETNEDIMVLGDTLNLAALGTKKINIRAELNTENAEKVIMILSGRQFRYSQSIKPPFTLFPSHHGNYFPWVPYPREGSYKITSVVHAYRNGHGYAGEKTEFEFVVIDEEVTSPSARYISQAGDESEIVQDNAIAVYPTVSTGLVNISLQLATEENQLPVQLRVYNGVGKEMLVMPDIKESDIQLDLSTFNRGMYFLKAAVGDKFYTQKFILE